MLRSIDLDFRRPDAVSAGPAPMLMWIEISKLVVDERYQRELKVKNRRFIKEVADNFEWAKFTCVQVAPVEGGFYAIIDGQHRTHAAAACGFTTVPCLVTHMTLEQQASSFAAINGIATAITNFQIYKAALIAGEPWAVGVRDAVEAAGCTLMTFNRSEPDKKAGEIYAIQYMRKALEQHGHDLFVKALSAIRRAEGLAEFPESYSHSVIRPLMEALMSRPHALDRTAEMKRFLSTFDVWDKSDEAAKFVADRRRIGMPSITKIEMLETLIRDAIDKAVPKRMSLPAPRLVPQLQDMSRLAAVG
jgi:hypothetical protein